MRYQLTRRLPDGQTREWATKFETPRDAARAVAYCLVDHGVATRAEAASFADQVGAAAIGSMTEHSSGYAFTINALGKGSQ